MSDSVSAAASQSSPPPADTQAADVTSAVDDTPTTTSTPPAGSVAAGATAEESKAGDGSDNESTLLRTTLSSAAAAVDKVVGAVSSFDERYGAGKARVWLAGAISVVTAATNNLKAQAAKLQAPGAITRFPVTATTEAVSQVRAGLTYMTEMARSYDSQYKMTEKLSSAVEATKTTANTALTELAAQLQRVRLATSKLASPSSGVDSAVTADAEAEAKDAATATALATAPSDNEDSKASEDGEGEGEGETAKAGLRKRMDAAYVAVQDVVKRVLEYERTHMPGTHSLMTASIAKLTAAAEDLKQTGQLLQKLPLRDIPRQAATESVNRARAAVQSVTEAANKFDEEHNVTTTATSAIQRAREHASTVLADATAYIASARSRVTAAADRGVDAAMNTAVAVNDRLGVSKRAVALDERFGISKTAEQLASAGIATAKKLDARLGVTATAASLDERIMGGRGTKAVSKGVELAGAGVQYLMGKMQTAMGAGSEGSDAASPAAADAAPAVAADEGEPAAAPTTAGGATQDATGTPPVVAVVEDGDAAGADTAAPSSE